MSETADAPPKPTALDVIPEGIPDVLKEHEHWLVWRYEWRNDEWTKPPFDGNGGGFNIDATDPSNGVPFETALDTYRSGDYDGLGVITSTDLPVGLDIDHCRDPEEPHGSVPELVLDIVENWGSYMELSPSGTGIRGWAWGEKPDGRNKRELPCEPVLDGESVDIEMYDGTGGRYLTVTGQHIDVTPAEIRETDYVESVHDEYIADTKTGESSDGDAAQGDDAGTTGVGFQGSDEELVEAAKAAKNGKKFGRLYGGDASGYDSHSEARQALANLLAFWTGGDERRMLDLFRQSDLCRGDDDIRTFENYEIPTATDGSTEFYRPSGQGQTADDGDDIFSAFYQAFDRYDLDPSKVAMVTGEDGEKFPVGLGAILPDHDDDEADIGRAIMAFNRKASKLSGTDRQAVIGHVVRVDLEAAGEFFKTADGRLFYFYDEERTVYRVDGDGNQTLDEDFRGLVWERYNLFAGRFSRNLGKDIRTKARRSAPVKAVYRFAHYDEDATELYVTDWGHGYYAISPDGLEWRPNGADVYFLSESYAHRYEYLDPEDRPELPDDLPGERPTWSLDGDPIMRVFGNRVNYDEAAALGPDQQRKQLYLHLHALPFIDLLNARPIMAWVGEKGSGKTVIERSIGRFIYGPDYTESTMPDAKDDFLAKVTNQALAFIDNYDDGVEWGNDVLAAIATGTGIDKRELYTTNSLRREVPRCWLSLTSRDPPFRRDDVADRTLVFRVERVEDGFVGTGTYLRQVETYRELLWSAYLDNLQRVLAEYDRRDTDDMASEHRMADWAIMAKVTADALGVDRVDELLETMATERASFALENEPWASVIGKWVHEEPDGTPSATWRKASELVEVFEDRDEASGPLANARSLGSKLVTYRDELGALYGLEIDETGRTNQYRFETDGETPAMAGKLTQYQ